MNKKQEITTIKVTKETAKNFKIAAAHGEKTVYEVAQEGSQFVKGKYLSKNKK